MHIQFLSTENRMIAYPCNIALSMHSAFCPIFKHLQFHIPVRSSVGQAAEQTFVECCRKKISYFVASNEGYILYTRTNECICATMRSLILFNVLRCSAKYIYPFIRTSALWLSPVICPHINSTFCTHIPSLSHVCIRISCMQNYNMFQNWTKDRRVWLCNIAMLWRSTDHFTSQISPTLPSPPPPLQHTILQCTRN